MFRITRLTDYGVLLLTQLALDEDRRLNAAELAKQAGVPLPTVSKILQVLLREGMLESIRGTNGGYRLSRSPSNISVRDIIAALEGPIAITECNLDSASCEQHEHCSTRINWQRINEAMRHALADISLADMAHPDFEPVIHMEKRGRQSAFSSS
jgi:FeS assembly SUF system regulator